MENFGKRIKAYRVFREYTVEQMIKVSGINDYNYIEEDKAILVYDEIQKLSDILGVPTDILIFSRKDVVEKLLEEHFEKLVKIHYEECIRFQTIVEMNLGENSIGFKELCDSQIEYLEELKELQK
jgi:transcriptional regulator with XRE-family HTH domain